MANDEFVELLPSFDKLLTRDELSEIFQLIGNEQFQPKKFNALRRTQAAHPWDEGAVIECDRTIAWLCKPYRIQNIETITFTTNKALLLGHLKCFSKYENPKEMYNPVSADMTIVRVPNEIDTQNGSTERIIVPTWKVELTRDSVIRLPKPIILDPKFKYKIQINMDNSEGCTTYRELGSEVYICDDIIVKFHDDPLVDGKRRLVHLLAFNRLK